MKFKKKDIKKIYSLTPLQEGMIFAKMRNSDDTSYMIQKGLWMDNKIDEAKYRTSLSLLCEKHETLKTAFVVTKSTGKMWQVIPFQRELEVNVICIDEEPSEKIIEYYCTQDLKRGFNYENDTMMRTTILQFANNKSYLLINLYHVIVDGWCISFLLSDLFYLYSQLQSGRSVESLQEEINNLNSESACFSDYVKWIERQNKEEGLNYWSDLLADYSNSANFLPLGKIDDNNSILTIQKQYKRLVNKPMHKGTEQQIKDFLERNN